MLQNKTHALHQADRTKSPVLPLTIAAALLAACLFPLGCSVGSSAAMSSALQKEQAAESTGIIPAQFFGMVVQHAALQPQVAIGARRLSQPSVSWAAIEPTPGQFTWDALDQAVASAQQAGAQVTLTLGMTPAWASSQPNGPGNGVTAMPSNLTDWDAYVAAVATRYRGRINAYEVWNAPENPGFWSGSTQTIGSDMALLAAHSSATVHAADPAALVVSPVLSATALAQFLSAGGGTSVDVIGVSLVSPGQSPEALPNLLQGIRAALIGTPADGKPLWNEQDAWTLPLGGLSPNDQAAWAARALLLNASFGIGRLHWFAWDDTATTVLTLTTVLGQPTPAAQAYSTVENWLQGANINGCASTASGLWTCQIVRGSTPEWILWSTTGTVQASGLGASTATDLTGTQTAVSATGMVTVTGSPILLQ